MNIEFCDFETHINNIRKVVKFQDSLWALCRETYRDNIDCEIVLPTLIDDVIDLLALATNDKCEWISYWIYELDFGDKYEDGMITDADQNIIRLKTVNDLWSLLAQEYDR